MSTCIHALVNLFLEHQHSHSGEIGSLQLKKQFYTPTTENTIFTVQSPRREQQTYAPLVWQVI